MKSTKFSILISLVLSIAIVVLVILTIARPSLFQPDIFVQDTPELSLPEGAKARFGKPDIHGTGGRDIHEVAYAPDGNHLAVLSGFLYTIYRPVKSFIASRDIGGRSIASRLARMGTCSPVGLKTIPSVCGMRSRVSTNEHSKGIQPRSLGIQVRSIAWHSVQMAVRLPAVATTRQSVCGMSPQASRSKHSLVMVGSGSSGT